MTSSSIPVAPQSNPQVYQPSVSSEEYLLKRNTQANIVVPLLENSLGCFGVFAATMGLWIGASALGVQVNWGAGVKFATTGALIFFGAANAVRFLGDEYRAALATRSVRTLDKDRSNLVQQLRMATERIQDLEGQLSVSGKYSSLAMAEQLLREHFFENKPMNRDTAMARGWTRPNWTLAYKHLQNAGVVDGRGQFREDAISYEAAMGKALTATHGSGRYVRAKDGSMIKVESYDRENKAEDEEAELPTIEVSSRSNREVKQLATVATSIPTPSTNNKSYPRPTKAYQASAYDNVLSTTPGYTNQVIEFTHYSMNDQKSQGKKAVYKG